MKKIFNKDGQLRLRFSEDAKEQICDWLNRNGTKYDNAIRYAVKVKCPVFGNAVEFPCIVLDQFDTISL